MSWLWIGLTALFLLDALRLRGRAGALAVAKPSSADSAGYSLVIAPGAVVPTEALASAAQFARDQKLDVVDLVPPTAPTRVALGLLQMLDPATGRADRFGRGRTAGTALLVSDSVLARAAIQPPTDQAGLQRAAQALKKHATASMDALVVPGLVPAPDPASGQWAGLTAAVSGMAKFAVLAQLVITALFLVALLDEPLWGVILLASWQLQPMMALAGTSLRPSDLTLTPLLRLIMELKSWVQALTQRSETATTNPVEERRATYEALLKDGWAQFLEPRRTTCPLCEGDVLVQHLSVPDLYQYKPGTFILDRCAACAHIFQNPRLSFEGLNFYYKDFYDGLGEEGLEGIFGFSAEVYLDRARMLEGQATPTKWLDVGTGHGHFPCAARDVWPECRFEGLDLSESITAAEHHGWVSKGYHGLFPDFAPEHAGEYDTVSMSHYLEHTREPREEIAAAAKVLSPGGHLLVEVPDPDCKTGGLLKSLWLPWFQPQHQHFVSVKNLDQILTEEGFEAVTWHRGESHQKVDLLFAAMILVGRISPKPHLPWKTRPALARRIIHSTVWTIGTPFILMGWMMDFVLSPFFKRAGWSNTYRVLARKIG